MAQKPTVERIETDLELKEDIRLHERGWLWQRIGWFFILLLVILAATGFFGDGVVSKKNIMGAQTTLAYERFYRKEARMEIKVGLRQPGGTHASVSFPNSYLEQFRIESIQPEPKEILLRGNSTHYLFPGTDSMTLVFYLIPQSSGSVSGTIGINNRPYPITHFIYP